MPLNTKKRSLGQITEIPPIYWEDIKTGGLEVREPGTKIEDRSTQITVSEPHRRNHKGIYTSGGPFYTVKKRFVARHRISFKGSVGDSLHNYVYKGPVFPFEHSSGVEEYFRTLKPRSQDTSDLDSLGATAIHRCSPVNPVDTLGQGVLELHREGLPSLPGVQSWEKRARILKAAGSEFLNVVFGWDPLVSEVKDFASTVRNAGTLLSQYHRNQGSNVARSFYFPIEESSDTVVISANRHAFLGTGLSGGGSGIEEGPFPWHTDTVGTLYLTTTRKVRKWFKGSFTYAVPSQSDSWRRMVGYGTDADKLFGIALTPELLWNIAPWSWAVDWFSNAGDVISNISDFAGAGLVMRYGYMMEENSVSYNYYLDRSGFFVGHTEIPPPSVKYDIVSKVRRPANPYGFGITSGSLSPLQIAIAAALGIILL